MGDTTTIAWTDRTFNPWWGCTRVSEACRFCYAEAFAHRLGLQVWGENGDRRFFGDDHWRGPVRWDARVASGRDPRRRVFCASMADVFEDHPDVGDARDRLWQLIEATPHLVWQLLTKRPENVRGMVPLQWRASWPANAWLGTTVENQARADERIPFLLAVPGGVPVRFLSCEPLLGALHLRPEWVRPYGARIGWVITGGESGAKARVSDEDWFRSLRGQCARADVPFFMKQMGTRWAREHGDPRGKAEQLDEMPEALRHRELPEVAA